MHIKYIKRLTALGNHLKSIEVNQKYSEDIVVHLFGNVNLFLGVNGKHYYLYPFVVQELPVLFEEWQLNERGQITYLGKPNLVNNYAIIQYFGLDIAQLINLFTLGNKIFLGFGAWDTAMINKPKDVAESLFQFLEKAPENKTEAQMYFTRRVLIEKIIFICKITDKKKKRRT